MRRGPAAHRKGPVRLLLMEHTDTPSSAANASAPDDEIEYDYTPEADPAAAEPQVSSYIAIIRIVSVLAMGLCVSFGLFLLLIGREALVLGIALILAAIPCYYGMQFAEKLAAREHRERATD
jgi:hypothetical protein